MWPVSETFRHALRQSHTVSVRVDAFSGSQCIASDLPVSDGSVEADSTSGMRRKLTVTIADPKAWDLLNEFGIELRAYRGIRFPGGSQEMVPLGVFGIDQISQPVLSGGALTISGAPDRFARVQRARFEIPRVSDTGFTNVDEVVRLVTEVVPVAVDTGGVTTANVLSGQKILSAVVWNRDRDQAITTLAAGAGVEVFFDRLGGLVIRDLPVMDSHPIYRVNAGRTGVMLGGTATRDRTRVYNVVVVSSTRTDGSAPFAPQVVADTDPTSPTNVNGAYGRVPYFYSTALIGTAAEAAALGRNLLTKTRARFIDMTCESVVNPALEPGDTIGVTGVDGRESLYLVASLSVPLSTEGSQSITLQTRAAVSGDSETVGAGTDPTDTATGS